MSGYNRTYKYPAYTDQGRNKKQQDPQYSDSYPAKYADYYQDRYQDRQYQSVDIQKPGFVLGDLDAPDSDEEGVMLAERQRERQQRELQQREHNDGRTERPRDGHGSDRRHSHGGRYDNHSSGYPSRPSTRDDPRASHAQGRNRDNGWSGEKEKEMKMGGMGVVRRSD